MSSAASPDNAIDPRAAREAAQWLVRLQTEGEDAAQLSALQHWRTTDPSHEAAWQRAQDLVEKWGLAGVSPNRAPLAMPLGTLGANALRQADKARRQALTRLLTVAILIGPAAIATWRLSPWSAASADLRTATGERRAITLPDGGKLLLDTASSVDIAYTSALRRIVLREGAIQVQTAADPQGDRPFIVQTPQGTVRALGTHFTVRVDGSTPTRATHVAVTQGAVEMRPTLGGQPVRVEAGQRASFTSTATHAPEARDPLADGWTEGVLYAEKMPLGRFVAELGRYRPGMLRCDPVVAHLPVSGAFQLADTDAALHTLAASLPVRVVSRTRYWVTVGPL